MPQYTTRVGREPDDEGQPISLTLSEMAYGRADMTRTSGKRLQCAARASYRTGAALKQQQGSVFEVQSSKKNGNRQV